MAQRSRVRTVTVITAVIIVVFAVAIDSVMALDKISKPTFTIDHKANTFLMDGKPFRYVSGSFHYFRALPEAWQDRLRTMRASGLNAIDTYVEWSLHNPFDGEYDWEGIADIEKFIKLASDQGFYVILRPGPYICAERDNGGLPHWLFTKYPQIKPRTSDPDYKREVATWYAQLMPRLERYLYGNGGPIIMVQIENEYSSFPACDHGYLNWLRDETEKYVHGNAVLFTTDFPDENMKCGKIDGVFATTDFGFEVVPKMNEIWKTLRTVQPTGPLVNSEYYPGWLTHWQEENQRRDGKEVADSLRNLLATGANVNIYMFFGGTNFGFTAGANDFGYGNYTPDITSYDYDAVMDEAGGITKKYELVRSVIGEFLELPKVQEVNSTKIDTRISYGKVKVNPTVELLSTAGRAIFVKGKAIDSEFPKTFEELNQYSGLVLYETTLPKLEVDPTLLTVQGLHDRAFVFVDQQFVGTLSRENLIYSLPLNKGWGNKLQLLVENQGRINFHVANDTKGILGDVTLQKLNGEQQKLTQWLSSPMPLDVSQVNMCVEQLKNGELLGKIPKSSQSILTRGPVVYYGEFLVSKIGDTYLNPIGWGKGVAYVNNLNLGRYWPLAGPQLTLYVPKEALRLGLNTLVLLEYQRFNKAEDDDVAFVQLDNVPQLDN